MNHLSIQIFQQLRVSDSQNGNGNFTANFLISNGVSSFRADHDGFGDTILELFPVLKSYSYQSDDRLTGFRSESTHVAYYYDPFGRRVAKMINLGGTSFTQTYLHLGMQDRILMGKGGDGTITTYIDGQGVDEHLGEVKDATAKGYVADHLGSVLNSEMAGPSKRFGLMGEVNTSIPVAPSMNPVMYGWQGLRYDAESGQWDNLARQYNPNTGTFLTQEPTGMDGPNLYWALRNNPLRFRDPDGLSSFEGDPESRKPGPIPGSFDCALCVISLDRMLGNESMGACKAKNKNIDQRQDLFDMLNPEGDYDSWKQYLNQPVPPGNYPRPTLPTSPKRLNRELFG